MLSIIRNPVYETLQWRRPYLMKLNLIAHLSFKPWENVTVGNKTLLQTYVHGIPRTHNECNKKKFDPPCITGVNETNRWVAILYSNSLIYPEKILQITHGHRA